MARAGQIRFFQDAATGDPEGIAFDLGNSFERFLVALIETPAMDRMGRILQLSGRSSMIGAAHTRRDHMIHAASMARHAIDRLQIAMDRVQTGLFDPRMGMACVAACALHDIGHPPRGHEFETVAERVSGQRFHHEDWSARLIREDNGIKACFAQFLIDHPDCGEAFTKDYGMSFDEMVVALIEGRAPKALASYQSIVSGKIDCDRGSFLPMDRAHTQGVELYSELPQDMWADIDVGQVDGVTVIVYDKSKVEDFLLAWREQYETIYYASSGDAKESMLVPILRDFVMTSRTMLGNLSAENLALYRVLTNNGSAALSDYLLLDDHVIDRVIRHAAENAADPWIRELAQRTLDDAILPTLDLSFLDKRQREGMERYLAAHLPEGVKLETHVFITNAKSRDINKLHKNYGTPTFEEYNNVAYVRNAAGQVVPVQQASYLIKSIPPLNAFYVHANPDVLEKLIPHVNDYLGAIGKFEPVQTQDIVHHTAVRRISESTGSAPAGLTKN